MRRGNMRERLKGDSKLARVDVQHDFPPLPAGDWCEGGGEGLKFIRFPLAAQTRAANAVHGAITSQPTE